MTYVTCRLTAKNRDQLRNPTLGNRLWATLTFFNLTVSIVEIRKSLLVFRDFILILNSWILQLRYPLKIPNLFTLIGHVGYEILHWYWAYSRFHWCDTSFGDQSIKWFVVWPTMSCFADWSKRRHVTFVIECWTCRRSTVQRCWMLKPSTGSTFKNVERSRDCHVEPWRDHVPIISRPNKK